MDLDYLEQLPLGDGKTKPIISLKNQTRASLVNITYKLENMLEVEVEDESDDMSAYE